MLIVALVLLAQLGTTTEASTADDAPTVLDPIWTRIFQGGLEWCAPVGGEPATAMLVCSKHARLDLIDVDSGRSRLAEPRAVQPGSRFAGSDANVAYVYGPTKAYAYRVAVGPEQSGAEPGELWQITAAPSAETKGDPEFLTRLLAAEPTPNGLLIVRNDGQVAELRRADGSARWQHKLPPPASCKLRARDHTAGLLWKRGDGFIIAFFDLKEELPRPKLVTIEDTLPIWSELIDEALVAVWPERFAVIPIEGHPRYHDLGEGVRAAASTVVLYVPRRRLRSRAPANEPPVAPALLLSSGTGALCAFDLETGRRRWFDDGRLRESARTIDQWRLAVTDDVVFEMASRGYRGYSIDSGEMLVRQDGPARPIGVGTRDGFAYALFQGSDPLAARRRPQPMRLTRQTMIGKPRRRVDEPVTPGPREFLLGTAGPLHDAFWLGGTLIIVEDQRIRAYTLP